MIGAATQLSQLFGDNPRWALTRLRILVLAGVAPLVVGSFLEVPKGERLITKLDRACVRQMPPFLAAVLKIRPSFITHYMTLVLDIWEKYSAGERYIADLLQGSWKKLKPRWAHPYEKQVEQLHTVNQEADRYVKDLEGINQSMGEMKDRVAPLLARAEQQVASSAEQISAEYERALEIQKRQEQIHEMVEKKSAYLATEMARLLQHQEENFMLAIRVLKDAKEAQESLENVRRKEGLIRGILEAILVDLEQ